MSSQPIPLAPSSPRQILCRNCGWPLIDLASNSACPNCRKSAAASVHGSRLKFSTPNFLLSLALGSRLVIAGFIFIAITPFAEVLAAWVGFTWHILWPFDAIRASLPVLRLAPCLVFTGWWLFTRPEPSRIGERKYGAWRRLARVIIFSNFFLALPSCFPAFLWGTPAVVALRNFVNLLRPSPLSLLLPPIHVFATITYVERLSMRIPDRRLTKSARFYKMVLLAFQLAIFVANLQIWAGDHSKIWPAVTRIANFGSLPFDLGYLVVLWQLGTRLLAQRQFAKIIWLSNAGESGTNRRDPSTAS